MIRLFFASVLFLFALMGVGMLSLSAVDVGQRKIVYEVRPAPVEAEHARLHVALDATARAQ